jgi:hypothetical protein
MLTEGLTAGPELENDQDPSTAARWFTVTIARARTPKAKTD